MSGRIRRVALAVATVASVWVAAGCSGDDPDESATGDEPGVDEVASSWGEIAPRDEERARTYLAGAGAPLLEYVGFAADLDRRLDDVAYDDDCADLRAEWDASYAGRELVGWLYRLPDPILGRLLSSQLPTAEQALAACAGGDRDASAELAAQVARIQELVDRRLEQLAVDR